MPAGPTFAGFGYFAGVKALGYTAASFAMKRGYALRGVTKPNVLAVGLTRTLIGVAAGALYGGLWIAVLSHREVNSWSPAAAYYCGLLPVRIAEWSLLIWLFFDRGLHDRARLWKWAGIGTLCSYALDVIGVAAAFVIPGGFWIC